MGKYEEYEEEQDIKGAVTLILSLIAFGGFLIGLMVGALISVRPSHQYVNPEEPAQETESTTEAEVTTETEIDVASTETDVPEEPEVKDPKIADYFVKTISCIGAEHLYEGVDENSIDSLIKNYNYFDFCSFGSEYLGNVKLAFLRSTSSSSVTLTAEQSPLGTPTKIIQNDLGWTMRIVKDDNDEVKDFLDEYEDYIDIGTGLDNDSNLNTFIYICHDDKCIRSVYKGKATPKDMIINIDKGNSPHNCDVSPAFNFVMNAEALKSFLKMAEEDILWDENPFEEIGDEWEPVEDYELVTVTSEG